MYTEPSLYPHSWDCGETSLRTVRLMAWRVSSMSASFILLRQRTVELPTLAESDPRGSVFLNRKATGSLMNISYRCRCPSARLLQSSPAGCVDIADQYAYPERRGGPANGQSALSIPASTAECAVPAHR